MFDIVYAGYSDKMVQYLLDSPYFHLCKVIGVNGRISAKQYELIQQHNIDYLELNHAKEIWNMEPFIVKADLIVMYKFEYIIPLEMIQRHMFFNFHGGNLQSNRGAHATVRSILNMDSETCLSLYQLTGGIDEGILVGEYPVHIDFEDNVLSLNQKLAKGIPNLLLELNAYLKGKKKGVLITGGTYLPKIKEEDYTIDFDNDSIPVICAKIKSQASYNGALLIQNNKRFRIMSYSLTRNECTKNMRIYEGNKILIYDHNNKLECSLQEEK